MPENRAAIECRWWPVFTVMQPGLSVTLHVDRDRRLLRMTCRGTKARKAKLKTVTRAVSVQDLRRIIGSGARLTNQYHRIMLGLLGPES